MGTKGEFTTKIKSFLKSILAMQTIAMDWLGNQEDKIIANPGGLKFFLAFSQASKYFSKNTLKISEPELVKARELRPGFQPQGWNELQTARTVLLLSIGTENETNWLETLDKLFETGDMHEQEALYAALPILPNPEKLTKRASEGLRTNITSIFDAIALDNPYPCEYLEEKAWNQLLLKAIFMQRPLYRIIGADKMANESLSKTLVDYVHERWSAGRDVMPELWRFVGPFLDNNSLPLLEKVMKDGSTLEKQAAALACYYNNTSPALLLLDKNRDLKALVESGKTDWETIGKRYYKTQYA